MVTTRTHLCEKGCSRLVLGLSWVTLFPPAGSLFTLGAGPGNSTVVESTKALSSDSAAAGNTRPPTTVPTMANIPPVQSKHISKSSQFMLSFLSELNIYSEYYLYFLSCRFSLSIRSRSEQHGCSRGQHSQ